MEKSFLDILTEKMRAQVRDDLSEVFESSSVRSSPNEKNSLNVDNSTTFHQAHSQWINQIPLGKIHFSTPKEPILRRVYPRTEPVSPRKAPTQPEALRRKHVLTEKQKQSVVYFWGWQIRLQEDFTAQELKKAFRSLAQRLHPDRNQGRSQAFIELKAHYQCLLSALQNKP